MEEVHISCINISGVCHMCHSQQMMRRPRDSLRTTRERTNFEHTLGNVVEHAPALHNHHARRDLVRLVGRRELLDRKGAQAVHPHS